MLAVLVLVPGALAWACNPQAQLVTNKASYAPGEAMAVGGSYFPKSIAIELRMSSGAAQIVTTSSSGSFTTSGFTAPGAPGVYTLTAVRANGQFQSGLPKTTSFSVASPAVDPTPQGQPPAPGSGGTGGNFVTDPTLRCLGRAVTRVGTQANDVIVGGRHRDVIAGLGGDDVVKGLAGGDVICGGTGRDRLVGGRGRDRLAGGAGEDRLRGGAGRDRLDGGAGDDLCLGRLIGDRERRCEIRGS